jgi:hypothetical protein
MQPVEAKYFRNLAQLFSRKILESVSRGSFEKSVNTILDLSGYSAEIKDNTTIAGFFDGLYEFLCQNYRCEYIYKNALTNQILDKFHTENSAILTEFRVDNCLADFLVLNGTSCAYEIKTELDSFERLHRQISAYRKMFDKIYVVTHYSHVTKLISAVDDAVGILYLDDNCELREERSPRSNKANVDPGTIFNSLRIAEYSEILLDQLGYVPDVPATLRYTVCREKFLQIDAKIIHDQMVSILKKRLPVKKIESAISEIPRSLKLLYLENKFTIKQNHYFLSQLNNEIAFHAI